MKIVIFGLSVTSAWGNGHATLLRGLFRALHADGHRVCFFERDVPYYASHRDAPQLPFADVRLYQNRQEIFHEARRELSGADVGMVTSYCPDGIEASDLVLSSNAARRVFYDLDTPVTLARLDRGETVEYVPPTGYAGFHMVLSYTGGPSLEALRRRLGAAKTAPLYGWVDPEFHHATPKAPEYASHLAYLGTYAPDRQPGLETLLLEPARRLPARSFLIAGAMYPSRDGWPSNVRLLGHVPPSEHSRFYSSSPLMLNVTRAAMAQDGYCPSGRLFESAACGTAVLSDWWTGLDCFFEPGREILVARSTEESVEALNHPLKTLAKIGQRARDRALSCHTAELRARQFLELIT